MAVGPGVRAVAGGSGDSSAVVGVGAVGDELGFVRSVPAVLHRRAALVALVARLGRWEHCPARDNHVALPERDIGRKCAIVCASCLKRVARPGDA